MIKEPLVKLNYIEGKDGMMYPNLEISSQKPTQEVGKFGKLWKEWMTEHHEQRVTELIVSGEINQKISQVDEEMELIRENLIQKLLEAQPFPQTEDTLARGAHLNMIYKIAEELIISRELFRIK
ncbi:MAG: TnpV protein [Clostridia bacterium]